MKILFAALKYDYGIKERGYSFEYYSFYDTLVAMGHEVEYFDFFTLYKQYGSLEMTRMLRRKVEEWNPELLFVFLFSDQFDFDELRKITSQTKTTTFNWFADDHWRFENFSRYWAPCFSFVSTTDEQAIQKYHSIGYTNAMLTQWAANPRIWKPGDGIKHYDVTFVGQAHGNRKLVMKDLERKGIPVKVWGPSWKLNRVHELLYKYKIIPLETIQTIADRTRLSQEEMITILRQTRINLNLSASSQIHENQIKGRNFEIPACKAFQLSGEAEALEKYFRKDKEIVCYRSPADLADIILYYLHHENEREQIAEAGYKRVLEEHTYEHRFRELFRYMHLIS